MRNEYRVRQMTDWSGVEADIAVTDPPFGIDFDGKASNYNRDTGRVADGYIEWSADDYPEKIETLLDTLVENTHENGQILVFSGWNNSPVVHEKIAQYDGLTLEGKLYWSYNFAPYCTRRPAHNVYEVYWAVKSSEWYYTNECQYDHCTDGEANLSVLEIPRNYLKEMPKYPTRLPLRVVEVLLAHFTEEGDVVFDPLAGAGSVGIAADRNDRGFVLGDANKSARGAFETTRLKLSQNDD